MKRRTPSSDEVFRAMDLGVDRETCAAAAFPPSPSAVLFFSALSIACLVALFVTAKPGEVDEAAAGFLVWIMTYALSVAALVRYASKLQAHHDAVGEVWSTIHEASSR